MPSLTKTLSASGLSDISDPEDSINITGHADSEDYKPGETKASGFLPPALRAGFLRGVIITINERWLGWAACQLLELI